MAQFVNELHKTVYAEDLKCVSLGSRKNLCINEEVKKLKSINRMNEKCLDMQKTGLYKKLPKGQYHIYLHYIN